MTELEANKVGTLTVGHPVLHAVYHEKYANEFLLTTYIIMVVMFLKDAKLALVRKAHKCKFCI